MSKIIQFKLKKGAVEPTKAGKNEVGYDLTIISVDKKINNVTTLYETNVIAIPPCGYYFEIVPRSSIIKTGYVLTNSVGIIDPTYRGTLKISLTKVNPSSPDLELPNKRFQLIPRAFISNKFTTTCINKIDKTERGDGGFGSTD